MSFVGTGPAACDFSIVVTLMEHRGLAEKCVASWIREQTYPRDRYELIVVSDSVSRPLERRLQRLLPVPHRLLRRRSNNESELYHIGATEARGQWLLFNESHCIAEPNYLDALGHFLASGRWDAAVGSSEGVCDTPLARMDERLFQEGAEYVRRHDDWRKVSVHGFAIRRDLYHDLGGLDPRFDRFAEWVLAARLRDRGCRIGFVDGARVRHHYRTGLLELLPSLAAYSRGEWAWKRARLPEPRIEEPFWPPEWTVDLPPDPVLARALKRGGGWRHLASYGGEAAALIGAMLRCRLATKLDNRLDRAYRDLWRHAVRLIELFLRRRHGWRTPPLTGFGECPIATIQNEHLFGFHAAETYQGRPFRWSGPDAAVRVALAPGAYEVSLDTGPLCQELARLSPRGSVNGSPLPPGSVRTQDTAAFFRLEVRGECRAGQWLVFHCDPLRPRDCGIADDRDLGLPVFGLRIMAAGPIQASYRKAA